MNIDLQKGCSVGVVVRSLDTVVKAYTDWLGLGPFEAREIELRSAQP